MLQKLENLVDRANLSDPLVHEISRNQKKNIVHNFFNRFLQYMSLSFELSNKYSFIATKKKKNNQCSFFERLFFSIKIEQGFLFIFSPILHALVSKKPKESQFT